MFFNGAGQYSFEEMLKEVENFIYEEKIEKGNEVQLIIGTDSQSIGKRKFLFATAVAVHSVGHGGTFFIKRQRKSGYFHLSERLFEEVSLSLEIAQKIKGNDFIDILDGIQVHADVGYGGKSGRYASAIKAMIDGFGFIGKIKPESPVATHIADNFVR